MRRSISRAFSTRSRWPTCAPTFRHWGWRATSAGETEDHVAYLLEVMRYLIAGDDVLVCNLEQQRRFFRAHLQPWVERLSDTVQAQPRAVLWREVASFTSAFVEVETQGFDMLE